MITTFEYKGKVFDFGGGGGSEEFIEVANYAALPVTGDTSVIYVTLDDNKLYRWTGSTYVELSGMTIDANPTDGSANAVSSNGVFDALSLKQNSLGFTAEDVANKQTDLTASATKYPTVNAVNTGLGTKQNTLVSGNNIRTINGNTLLGSTDLVINTPPSGLTGQIQFNNGGSFGADSNLFWDNTNKRLGIGATPATTVRLDVRAQGALSTDIAFRVRNSADTADILSVNGNRSATVYNPSILQSEDIFVIRGSNGAIRTRPDGGSGMVIMYSEYSGYGKFWEIGDVYLLNGVPGYSGYISLFNNLEANPSLSLAVVGNSFLSHASSNLILGAKTVGTSGTGVFSIKNGTVPTTSPTDQIQIYSADITAGNAAGHCRTENGAIIKWYQETTAVASSTLVSNAGTALTHTDTFDGYTVQQVVKALRNQGLLA